MRRCLGSTEEYRLQRPGGHIHTHSLAVSRFMPNLLIRRHAQPYTYDLLPSGDTGFYWANGILVGSTLAPFQSNGGWVQILSSNPERLGSSTLVGATNK